MYIQYKYLCTGSAGLHLTKSEMSIRCLQSVIKYSNELVIKHFFWSGAAQDHENQVTNWQ